MKIHRVKCDYCNKQADLKYNGEHWLVPPGWLELYDDTTARTIDQHVCDKCKPKRPTAKAARGGE